LSCYAAKIFTVISFEMYACDL